MEEVRPVVDFARMVRVEVFQGEARLTRDNIPLGKFDLGLSPRRIVDQPIQVRFTYNINGILEVAALEEATGKSERIVIQHSAYAPEGEEAEARLAELAALKLHPRDRAASKLLLARAERFTKNSWAPSASGSAAKSPRIWTRWQGRMTITSNTRAPNSNA